MTHFDNLDNITIPDHLFEQLPISVMNEDGVLPLREDGEALRVIVAAPESSGSFDTIEKLRFILNRPITYDTAPFQEIAKKLVSMVEGATIGVSHCPLFSYECSRDWHSLWETDDGGVRFCDHCSQNVYLCLDENDLRQRRQLHQCGAVAQIPVESVTMGVLDFGEPSPRMTQREWTVTANSHRMLEFADGVATFRQRRLALAGICRSLADVYPPARDLVDLLESTIDDEAPRLTLVREMERQFETTEDAPSAAGPDVVFRELLSCAADGRLPASEFFADAALTVAELKCDAAGIPTHAEVEGEASRQRTRQAAVVRDVIPSPFGPVAWSDSWLSSDVIQLAAAMYDSSDYSNIMLLHDALCEAGCQLPEVLDHCRRPFHTRGCWLVEAVR
ncbi:MAG: hypothetical protein QF805_23510, partial [Pirellulaceae bacterium]|nr:hypothetical protein [Pirellulaceae bacterium]